MSELPREFLELWNHTARLLAPSVEASGSKIRALPASVQQAAEHLEDSSAFNDFVRAAPWGISGVAPWRVGQVLRRAGFYHAMQSRHFPESVWEVLSGHLTEYTTRVRTFVLLDGARFAIDRFTVADAQVLRPTVSELERLGPPHQVARAFFPNEYLDPKWFAYTWFLTTEEDRTKKPTGIYVRFGYDVRGRFWKPLIALALYKPSYFATPIIIESEAGWRLQRVEWSDPMIEMYEGEEIPSSRYDVEPEETERFLTFLRFCDKSIASASGSAAFRIASRRHLRGLSIGGPWPAQHGDDYEDALLQYVFALEALFLSGETVAIADKIATRCAWAVGVDDEERGETFRAVKELYNLRSAVVHGETVKSARGKRATSAAPDLEAVRDLVRRALLGVLAVREVVSSDDECRDLFSSASVNRSSQDRLGAAITAAREMIEPRLDGSLHTWGPKFGLRRPMRGS